MDLSNVDHLLAALAGMAAGLINAVAGGGTLVSFPTLVALGVPAVQSNVTNTVALCPGYFGGAVAQRRDLSDQASRARALAVVAAGGGLAGSVLLVNTSEDLFRGLVPYLLLAASVLLAFGDRLRALLPLPVAEPGAGDRRPGPALVTAVFAAAVYGGYFGAGLGIMVLATLGLLLDDRLARLNALKQVISLVTNVAAALFFVSSGRVVWSLVVVMAPAALVGGAMGGIVARHLAPRLLRLLVVALGVAVAGRMLAG